MVLLEWMLRLEVVGKSNHYLVYLPGFIVPRCVAMARASMHVSQYHRPGAVMRTRHLLAACKALY